MRASLIILTLVSLTACSGDLTLPGDGTDGGPDGGGPPLPDQVRVVGRSKDDLQKAMSIVRDQDFGIPLQFTNYRG